MSDIQTPQAGRYNNIRDARGRRVTQLDPVALYLLRQYSVIDADTLRSIANEPGVRIGTRERLGLIVGICAALLVVGLFTFAALTGDLRDAPYAKSASLVFMCSTPWFAWHFSKRMRFQHVAAAMLRHRRCPHCGYDLRNLPADQGDGTTICPECGCAWRLADKPGEEPEAAESEPN